MRLGFQGYKIGKTELILQFKKKNKQQKKPHTKHKTNHNSKRYDLLGGKVTHAFLLSYNMNGSILNSWPKIVILSFDP